MATASGLRIGERSRRQRWHQPDHQEDGAGRTPPVMGHSPFKDRAPSDATPAPRWLNLWPWMVRANPDAYVRLSS